MGARVNAVNFGRGSICFTLKWKSKFYALRLWKIPSNLKFARLQVAHAIQWLLQVLNLATSEIVPANPNILDGVDNLIKLAYLNEPSVLHNLRFRYSQEMIYVCMPALAFSLAWVIIYMIS